ADLVGSPAGSRALPERLAGGRREQRHHLLPSDGRDGGGRPSDRGRLELLPVLQLGGTSSPRAEHTGSGFELRRGSPRAPSVRRQTKGGSATAASGQSRSISTARTSSPGNEMCRGDGHGRAGRLGSVSGLGEIGS